MIFPRLFSIYNVNTVAHGHVTQQGGDGQVQRWVGWYLVSAQKYRQGVCKPSAAYRHRKPILPLNAIDQTSIRPGYLEYIVRINTVLFTLVHHIGHEACSPRYHAGMR